MSAPLAGLRVVVTRSRTQAGRFSRLLSAAGASPVEVPTIEIRPRDDAAMRDAALAVDGYDDLVFTSPNGVRAFSDAMIAAGRSPSAASVRVCVVGPATARVAAARGWAVSLVPERDFVAESVVSMMAPNAAGRLVLFPRAARARAVVEDGLRAAGATVDIVVAYEALPCEAGRQALRDALDAGVDLVTVASSNTARFLDRLVEDEDRARLVAVPFASIGPITSATVRELGYRVAVEASASTLPGLVEAIVAWNDRGRDTLDGGGGAT